MRASAFLDILLLKIEMYLFRRLPAQPGSIWFPLLPVGAELAMALVPVVYKDSHHF